MINYVLDTKKTVDWVS